MKRIVAALAWLTAVLLAGPQVQAAPGLSMSFPGSFPVGGTATLYLSFYDDLGSAYTGGALNLTYPAGLVNVGGVTFDNCGGVNSALPGAGGFSVSGISLPASGSCFIYLPLTSATPGNYTLVLPAGAMTSSSGSNAVTMSLPFEVVAPIVVTNTADAGAGSFRAAIDAANASCVSGLGIAFNIPGTGPHTIQPATALPGVTCGGLIIDGSTQPSSSANNQFSSNNANIQVILNGSACTGCNGITITGSGVTVRGFSIHSFSGAGIQVDASGAQVFGNYLGTDPGGMTPLGNLAGVRISSGYAYVGAISASDHNLISGNGTGIWSLSGALVSGNKIGVARDGNTSLGNVGRGIFYNGSNYTTSYVQNNVIRFNGLQGISIDNATVTRTTIAANSISDNGGIGIDLGDDGPTLNDEAAPPYDTDGGPNRLINYPVVTAVTQTLFGGGSGTTRIDGYVKSEANSDVTIELYANSAVTPRTEGAGLLTTLNTTLDSTGFASFSTTLNFLTSNVSAQMTADTCGDGCVYSSEFSPSVAAVAPPNCSIYAGDFPFSEVSTAGPTAITRPGVTISLFASCFGPGTFTYAWSTGATINPINVTAPAAGATATYSVTVTGASGSSTVSVTLQGAAAGTPVCSYTTSVPQPFDPFMTAPFQVTAVCSPAATGFAWFPTFTPSTGLDYVSGQGTATITYRLGSTRSGIGWVFELRPTNAAGEGATVGGVLWIDPLVASPTTLAFGTIAAGTQSPPQSVTIQNLADYPAIFGINVAISGPYMATNNCQSQMPASSSCTIDFRYAPVIAGTSQPGTATITYGFPHAVPRVISLSGSATGAPGTQFTPSSLTFPARTLSTTSGAQTITLANNGTATLNIASITVTGDFAFTSACPVQLAPGASCTIDVTFTPLVAGARNGTLTVADDAPGSPHVAALTGTGVSGAVPVAEVSPSVVDFSPQQVGRTSEPETVTVTNTGNAPLAFTTIALAGEFSIVAPPAGATPETCGAPLPPTASCRIDLVFRPAGVNLREGSLTIATNGGTIVLTVVGVGMIPEPPQLKVPATLDLGSQRVGVRSAGRQIPLQNVSTIPATLTEFSATGDFAVSDACVTIAAGATCSPLVTFLPTAVGPRSGTLSMRTLRDADPYLVELSGVGEENRVPVLQLSVSSLGFGNAFIAMGVTREVTLRNIGQETLLVSGITFTGDFMSNGSCVGALAPSASCTVNVSFLPAGIGSRGGTMTITSNDPAGPHAVTLGGVGCFVPSPSRARLGGLLCGS